MLANLYYLRIVTNIDLLLFFVALVGSGITETYLCERKPFEIPHLQDALIQNHIDSNDTEEFMPQNTLWDYRQEVLEKVSEYGPEAYHITFISLWAILVSYFVLEIWLYCVLRKALKQKRAGFCKKWLIWRFVLVLTTCFLMGRDILGYQLTCTDAFVLPLSIFRILHFFLVVFFSMQLRQSSSTESIVMVGSEKL